MRLLIDVDAEQLSRAMREAPEAIHEEIQDALMTAGAIVQQEAVEHHAYRDGAGNLTRSVQVEVNDNFAEVYLDEAIAPYAPYVHNGTRAHTIYPKRKQCLRWADGQMFHFAKRVEHPGTHPVPFLYDALDAKSDEISEMLREAVSEVLEAVL